MLGSEQVKPVIGAVESGSLAASAGLEVGQEIVAVDGEPTSGWGAVNLQLVRRLGESGTVDLLVREAGSSVEALGSCSCRNGYRARPSLILSRRWGSVRGVHRSSLCWLSWIPKARRVLLV